MSLLDFLRPQGAQMPGMAQPRQSGLSLLLGSPEARMAMAGQLMGNQGNAANFGNAMTAGALGIGRQRELQAQTAEQNKTMEFFRKNAPEYAAMAEAGMPIQQVWSEYTQQRHAQPKGEFRMATPEEAARYGAQGGQFGPDGRFHPINPPQGMTIESDGAGGFRMVQGPGAGTKFTEAQSKDNVYSTKARGALPTLEKYEEKLTSLGNRALDADPTGIVRGGLQSSDYQVAQAAGDEFLMAILRKETGAAITQGEHILYGKMYLPQPGDGPEAIAYKRQARQRAVSAIEAGMTPAQMVAQERALQASGGNAPAAPPPPPTAGNVTKTGVQWSVGGPP
jgi:hypothetical protein